MWGAQADAATFTGDCDADDPAVAGAAQTHVRCAAEIADEQLGRMLEAVAALDEADGGETLVVLTADHGATYGEDFYGKTGPVGISNSNWYYAPVGVFDAGSLGPFVPPTDPLYNLPSPALQPLIDTGNVQFSYQSTAIETWLLDHSLAKKREGADAMLEHAGRDRVVLARRRSVPALRDERDDRTGEGVVEAARAGARRHHGRGRTART